VASWEGRYAPQPLPEFSKSEGEPRPEETFNTTEVRSSKVQAVLFPSS
jgi:hypothetical protein